MLQANGEPDPEPGVWEDNPPTATNYTRAPGLDLAAMYQSYQTGSLSLSDQYKSITGSEKYRSLHSFSKDRPMGMHNRKEFDPTTTTYIRVLYGVMGFCAIGWPLLLLLTGSGTWAMGWTKLVPALAIAAGGWWEQRNQHISASIVDAALFFRAGLLMSMPFYLAQVRLSSSHSQTATPFRVFLSFYPHSFSLGRGEKKSKAKQSSFIAKIPSHNSSSFLCALISLSSSTHLSNTAIPL